LQNQKQEVQPRQLHHRLLKPEVSGGYVVGFLSKAVSKIDGMVKHYKMLHGSVETIPMLTAEEHDFLMAFAQSYDEKIH